MITTHSTNSSEPGFAIRSKGLRFRWHREQAPIQFPDISLPQGENLFLRGPSGTGKSTLLGLLSGLSPLQDGELSLLGQDVRSMRRSGRDRLRADRIGVIFQQLNLVPYLNTLNNTLLPCTLSKLRHQQAKPTPTEEAQELLNALAIPRSHWHSPISSLSIGQQQRVAAARALIGAPALILADEPTSALDATNRDRFIDLLLDQARQRRTSVLLVSHDESLATHFDHHLSLGDPA